MTPTPPLPEVLVPSERVVSAEPLPKAPSDGRRWLRVALGVLSLGMLASLGLAWRAEQRVASVEQELVRRQQDSASQSGEARMLA